MSATDDVVNKALEGLDDNLQPIKDTEEADKTADDQDDKSSEDKTQDDSTDDKSEDESEDKDEGYVIDDDVEEAPAEVKPAEAPKTNLNAEQQYIYDGLPTLSVTGKDGKSYNIKVPGELPKDFEFASDVERMSFTAGIAHQENEAGKLQNTYQMEQNVKSTKEFESKENQSIVDDIAELQRNGDLPKFKLQPTDKNFDSDPAAKQVDDVIAFMNKRNEKYLKDSNDGKSFRHIGFEDAFYLYKQQNPEKTRSAEQQAEDKQRKEVGRSVGSRGANSDDNKTPIARSGTTTRDLFAMIDNL